MRILRASTGLALALLITAFCFPAEAAKRVVRVATGDAPYRVAYEKIAAEYQKLHPDVEVRIQVVPADGYATWIRTAVAGGADTCPDIFNINNSNGYFESGRAISLRPYLDAISPYSGKPWRETFFPQYLEMLRVMDDYPSVPINFIEVGFYYNKKIFAAAGIAKPPATWEEFLSVCKRIRAAGYVPVAMPADFENTWAGTFGWLVRIFTDAFYYDYLPAVAARPGDFAFNPATDARFTTTSKDRFSDLLVNISMERYLQAVLDGDLPYDAPPMRELYERIHAFSKFWQPGFAGTDLNTCYFRYFLAGRAAIFLHTSAGALQWDNEMQKLPAESRFDVGVFAFPPIASTASLCAIPFRGTGAPMPVYGILKKDKAQQDAAADFLMYLTTPKSGQLILDQVLAEKKSIVGPFAIQNVPMAPELAERFEPFLGRGREKMQLRGLYDEQQSTWRWALSAQDYLGDRLSVDEFLASYQQSVVEAIPRIIKMYDLDMDARTRDTNSALLAELPSIVEQAGTSTPLSIRTHATYGSALAQNLKVMAGRESSSPEHLRSAGIALVEERTIPFQLVSSAKSFDEACDAAAARRLAEAHGFQYLAVVRTDLAQPALKVFNFRPAYQDVLRRLSGRRYPQDQLRKLWAIHFD